MDNSTYSVDPASYRDPSGFIFCHEGIVYRQVNKVYKSDFDLFISSGLYEALINNNELIPHVQVNENFTGDVEWYTTLKPVPLCFISYPYEWSFDMLKDAALLTLSIAKRAMQFGMILKDASPYNIQFHEGRMIFIDSLSFEKYNVSEPWKAYRQFCENFLSPLSLMHYYKEPFQPLQLAYPEGIPLSVTTKWLPWKSKLNLHLYLHLYLHAKYAAKPNEEVKRNNFSSKKLSNIYRSLTELINYFSFNFKGPWANYYEEAESREDYVTTKKNLIENWLNDLSYVKSAIDTGANDGKFSSLLQQKGIFTISADSDHFSINNLYSKTKKETNKLAHPIIMDFANPSPAIGINNFERRSLLQRVKTDLVLSLAFIHHLAIGRNVPFSKIAELFLNLGNILLIEFVAKNDEKVQFMLKQKSDVYSWYSEETFVAEFKLYYKIIKSTSISSTRTLYLMKPHENKATEA